MWVRTSSKLPELVSERNDFLPQLVRSVVIQGLESDVPRILQERLNPTEMRQRISLDVFIVRLCQAVYLVFAILTYKIEIERTIE